MSGMRGRLPRDRFFDNDRYDDFLDDRWKDLLKNTPELGNIYKHSTWGGRNRRNPNDFFSNFRNDISQRFSPESPSSRETPDNFPSFSRQSDSENQQQRERPHTNLIDNGTQTSGEELNSNNEQKPGLSQYNLRNTVDLGRDARKLNDFDKNKRSMSAPPEARSATNQSAPTTGASDAPKDAEENKPVERIIPIVVEGRDEPLINKINTSSTNFATPKNAHQQEDDRFYKNDNSPFRPHFSDVYGGTPRINRIFPGDILNNKSQKQSKYSQEHEHPQSQHEELQRPRYFYQQKNRPSEERAQQQQPQQQQEPKDQVKSHNVHVDEQSEHQPSPPQPSHLSVNDPIAKIQLIQNDVLDLMTKVENFSGKTKKDKEYIYLDEMLTRNLLKLDDIDTEGKENIRLARREAIKCIQQCINVLEAKAESARTEETTATATQSNDNQISENASNEDSNKMEVEEQRGQVHQEMDTEPPTPSV